MQTTEFIYILHVHAGKQMIIDYHTEETYSQLIKNLKNKGRVRQMLPMLTPGKYKTDIFINCNIEFYKLGSVLLDTTG